MIFVDSNVFIYAVGRPHPLRTKAREFFVDSRTKNIRLVTSAEVLQELLHVYLPVGRVETLDRAFALAQGGVDEIFPINAKTVDHARVLHSQHPALTARDLIHLAVCQLHGAKKIQTFDKALAAAFSG